MFSEVVLNFLLDVRYKKTYDEPMTDQLREIVEQNLALTGKKKEAFLREARALRANMALRKKQQKEREKQKSPK